MRSVFLVALISLSIAAACSTTKPTETEQEPLTEPAVESGQTPPSSEETAKAADKKTDEVDLALLESAAKDPKRIANGEDLYSKTCAACHGREAQGLIGPNLTDEYWLHGGDLMSIYETVYHGVPDKGCPTWSAPGQYERDEIVDMVAFIDSIRGTNPDRPKSPEGERYEAN
jgi:cytochrome c oxidase cbb3-type subunit 3